MDIITGLTLLPLQVTDMSVFNNDARLGNNAKYLGIGIVIFVVVMVIIYLLKNKFKIAALNDGANASGRGPRRFKLRDFHRITREMGLKREQAKMLDYVFRCDGVTDPVRSIHSSNLLDKHFKRAYRLIERTSSSAEEVNRRLSVLFAVRNIIDSNADTATTSTRQIPENTAAVLSVNSVNYPVRVISSRGDTLVVENPTTSTGELLSPSKGSKVSLEFFTKNGNGFSVESRIMGNVETAEGSVLQLVHSGQIKKLSNRRFRRRQTVISTSFFFVSVENPGHKKKEKLIVDKRRFSGNTLDISIGGCSIKTTTSLSTGQKIKIEFTREDNSVIVALGEVLRVNRSGTNVIIHTKFLKIPRRSLNTINAVVYEYADK
jgi:DNA-binding LytR/AlgR family response regulator